MPIINQAGFVASVSTAAASPEVLRINVPVGVSTAQIQIQRTSGFGGIALFGDGSLDTEGPEGQAAIISASGELLTLYEPGGAALFTVTNVGLVQFGNFATSAVKIGHPSATLGFFGAAAVARPTGVPVTAAGIHAALVSLGLITA